MGGQPKPDEGLLEGRNEYIQCIGKKCGIILSRNLWIEKI